MRAYLPDLIKIISVILVLSVGVFRVYAQEDTQSAKELFYESLSLYKQGKVREAAEKMEAVYELDPDNANVVFNAAKFSGESGQHKKAIKYYKKLMQLEPDNVHAEAGFALYQSMLYARAKQYAKGAALLGSVINKVPDNASILWNLALLSALAEQHKSALKYWKRFSKSEPNNMLVQSKIIQAYQALEDQENRDKEIKKIYSMYERNADPGFIRKNRFCREQYPLGEWRIYVFQYFHPGDKDRYFYRYSVTDTSGREQFWLSLGSYQTTTDIAREAGTISDSERIYHLDYYGDNLHSLKAMYETKPGFDKLRQITKNIIADEIKRR